MAELQESLREYRGRNSLMQKQVAERLGITRGYYAMVEDGRRPLSHSLLFKVARLLDVSICEICPHKRMRGVVALFD